jgi:hypothetical protein
VTNFGQELLAGAATALSVFGLPTFGAASVAVDGNGNVSTGLDVPSPGDLLKNLFSGIAPALWIGGGAILVMLAIIMLNDIAPTPKAIVKKVVS